MTGQATLVLDKATYPHATFMMIPAHMRDFRGMDIPAMVRQHPKHGDVKIFSGYQYGNNLEFRWSLDQDCGETDSMSNLLERFGIENS